MKFESSKVPAGIAKAEAELRFQRLVIQGIEPLPNLEDFLQREASTLVVVVRILSSSEILLKEFNLDGNVEYQHLQYGSSTVTLTEIMANDPEWEPVGASWKDPALFLREYGSGACAKRDVPGIHFTPVAFKYHIQ